MNIAPIVVLFIAWLIVVLCFFVLAVQFFVTLIEFKLATLAGFVLVPFALWNKTAFLTEKVLGNVVASGIKVLVLAVIVGIGTGLFAEFTVHPAEPSIDHALVIMLASLALLALGIFGPGIATGLVSGVPQLGAGAMAGAAVGAAGAAVAVGAAATGAGDAAAPPPTTEQPARAKRLHRRRSLPTPPRPPRTRCAGATVVARGKARACVTPIPDHQGELPCDSNDRNRRVVAMRAAQEDNPGDPRFLRMPAWRIAASTPENVIQDLLNEIHLGSVRGCGTRSSSTQRQSETTRRCTSDRHAHRLRHCVTAGTICVANQERRLENDFLEGALTKAGLFAAGLERGFGLDAAGRRTAATHSCGDPAQSGLGDRSDIHPDGARVPPSDCRHQLVHAQGSGVAVVVTMDAAPCLAAFRQKIHLSSCPVFPSLLFLGPPAQESVNTFLVCFIFRFLRRPHEALADRGARLGLLGRHLRRIRCAGGVRRPATHQGKQALHASRC